MTSANAAPSEKAITGSDIRSAAASSLRGAGRTGRGGRRSRRPVRRRTWRQGSPCSPAARQGAAGRDDQVARRRGDGGGRRRPPVGLGDLGSCQWRRGDQCCVSRREELDDCADVELSPHGGESCPRSGWAPGASCHRVEAVTDSPIRRWLWTRARLSASPPARSARRPLQPKLRERFPCGRGRANARTARRRDAAASCTRAWTRERVPRIAGETEQGVAPEVRQLREMIRPADLAHLEHRAEEIVLGNVGIEPPDHSASSSGVSRSRIGGGRRRSRIKSSQSAHKSSSR